MSARVFATELRIDVRWADVRSVQWELFVFRDVYDVLPTRDAGTVVVIHTGDAAPHAWRAQLRASALGRDLPDAG